MQYVLWLYLRQRYPVVKTLMYKEPTCCWNCIGPRVYVDWSYWCMLDPRTRSEHPWNAFVDVLARDLAKKETERNTQVMHEMHVMTVMNIDVGWAHCMLLNWWDFATVCGQLSPSKGASLCFYTCASNCRSTSMSRFPWDHYGRCSSLDYSRL